MNDSTFYIIGISARTTNQNDLKALAIDMQNLWNTFLSQNIAEQIPNRVDHSIYCIYTDYEGKDHTHPYTAILGCKVSSLDIIPEGMVGKEMGDTHYEKFTAKGKLSDNIILSTWLSIWNTPLKRKYTADFEVYGQKALNPNDAEVDIFVAVE
jgi:predicted transcriptional regulator YdeE